MSTDRSVVVLLGGLALCGCAAMSGPAIAPVTFALLATNAGVALTPSIAAELFTRFADWTQKRSRDRSVAAKNHDLRELVAVAIENVMDDVATQRVGGKQGRRIVREWRSQIRERLVLASVDDRFRGTWEETVPHYFKARIEEFGQVRALTPVIWAHFLNEITYRVLDEAEQAALAATALALHENLPKQLVGVYRDSLAHDPTIFVAVQTAILQEIWNEVRRSSKAINRAGMGIAAIQDDIRQLGAAVLQNDSAAMQSLAREFLTEAGEFRVLAWTIEFLARDTRSMLTDFLAREPARDGTARQTVRAIKTLTRTVAARDREEMRKRCRVGVEERIRRLLGDSTSGRYEPIPYQARSMLMSDKRRAECVGVFIEQFMGKTESQDALHGAHIRNCFVVTGRTGHGKTTLICKMAEAASARDNTICAFLEGRTFQNHGLGVEAMPRGSRYEVAAGILAALGGEAPVIANQTEVIGQLIDRLHTLVGTRRTPWRVVIFLDAINEVPHQSAAHLADLNAELVAILSAIARGPDGLASHVAIVITCREEYWRHFNGLAGTPAWSQYIWNSAVPQAPSLRLDVYDDAELRQAKDAYFRSYHLSVRGSTGGSETSRLDILLREPVLLRYFCEAYGSRDPGASVRVIDDPTRITRIAIFERMAQTYRETISPYQGGGVATASTRMHPTTALLLSLAYVMHGNRRLTFTPEEAYECALSIQHPDVYADHEHKGRQLTIQEFVEDPRSSFARMIAERIVVEREPGSGTYSFIFDSYFEFSLGRYITYIRWAHLAAKAPDPVAAIAADLRDLLKQAAPEVSIAHPGVTAPRAELFNAIYYAILLLERDALFSEKQELFWRLVGVLLEATQDHLWRQQGLAIVRDSQFALPDGGSTSTGVQASPTPGDRLNMLLRQMHAILDGADHVSVWDIEVTLQHLSAANAVARARIISTVSRWARESVNSSDAKLRLRRMAAARILSGLRLAADDPVFDEEFARLVTNPILVTDFWSARSLISVARGAATAPGREGPRNPIRRRYFAHLLRIIRRNRASQKRAMAGQALSEAVAVRAIGLAAALSVAASDGDHAARLQELLSAESHPWIWWSIARELKKTRSSLRPELVRWVIERCERVDSPHVRQALLCLSPGAPRSQAPGTPTWGVTPIPSRRSSAGNSSIAIVYHPIFLDSEHKNHPECRERLASILFALDELPHLEWHEPFLVSESQIARAHNENSDIHRGGAAWSDYIDQIKASSIREDVQSLPSGALEMRPGMYDDACYSAGAVVAAVEIALQSGGHSTPLSAWAVHRPPGHLANNTICVFNNAAIAALHAHIDHGLERIMVIDFDAHHGRHTERVFYHRSDIVYVSLHIDDLYTKEAGSIERVGEGAGAGYTFNLPYMHPPDDHAFVRLAAEFIAPAIRQFRPNLVLFSAGFDGLASDPLTPRGGLLTVNGYRGFARVLRASIDSLRATQCVHVAGCLEGGYSLEELGSAFAGFIREFATTPCTDAIRISLADPLADEAVTNVLQGRLALIDSCRTPHFTRELFTTHRMDPASLGIVAGGKATR